jgi:ubiquinone/menaquinone biosynthesis C-methylase UbiE
VTARGPPATLVTVLRVCADASLPENVAVMRLILATKSAADLDRHLALAIPALDRKSAARLRKLAGLARRHPEAWRKLHAVAAAVSHDAAADEPVDKAVADIAASFDNAARSSPEASVALYSLGDPERLAAATTEIVAWLREAGLLGPEKSVLDIGCGIGRLEAALAAEVDHIVGTDVSAEMIRTAQGRCAKCSNVEFRLTSGMDLAEFADASFDCVLAVDAFPYLIVAGGDLAERHFTDAARVLKPGGELVILNYSYRDSLEQDRADVERLSHAAGLETVLAGGRPFRGWDGTAYRLAKLG